MLERKTSDLISCAISNDIVINIGAIVHELTLNNEPDKEDYLTDRIRDTLEKSMAYIELNGNDVDSSSEEYNKFIEYTQKDREYTAGIMDDFEGNLNE